MSNPDLEKIKAHIAGATVAHSSPFGDLISFKNEEELAKEFIDEWISPFYMDLERTDENWISTMCDLKPTITKNVIEKSLGDFNWRTRQTGAYFAAITNSLEFIDIIGTHFLKSELAYAGRMYSTVMAYFNTLQTVNHLNSYLDHYLQKPDLWFDQEDALTAIAYLDKENGTGYFDTHKENWIKFIHNKPYWKKDIDTAHLEKVIAVMKVINNR